jgi:hypothetical protein
MGLIDLLNHLLNFVAPAMALALVLPLAARFVVAKGACAYAWWAQVGINFLVGFVVLLASVWWWGRDGKMGAYAALILVMTSCQWTLSRGWRG